MEGLVGFGFPWAVVAPSLISLGVVDLAAIRVAAIADNAPVSFGALGAPVPGLAAVTGLPVMALSSSIGHIVAILALLPLWILILLVTGWRGIRDGWPLAIVGSILCFAALLLLVKVWRPSGCSALAARNSKRRRSPRFRSG